MRVVSAAASLGVVMLLAAVPSGLAGPALATTQSLATTQWNPRIAKQVKHSVLAKNGIAKAVGTSANMITTNSAWPDRKGKALNYCGFKRGKPLAAAYYRTIMDRTGQSNYQQGRGDLQEGYVDVYRFKSKKAAGNQWARVRQAYVGCHPKPYTSGDYTKKYPVAATTVSGASLTFVRDAYTDSAHQYFSDETVLVVQRVGRHIVFAWMSSEGYPWNTTVKANTQAIVKAQARRVGNA